MTEEEWERITIDQPTLADSYEVRRFYEENGTDYGGDSIVSLRANCLHGCVADSEVR